MIEELRALVDQWRADTGPEYVPAEDGEARGYVLDANSDHADELEAILSRHDWQPMDTAPKDGTRILAIWGEHGRQIIYWHSWEKRPEYRVKAGACWMPENQRCPINARPTCWVPLPSPPEAAEQKP